MVSIAMAKVATKTPLAFSLKLNFNKIKNEIKLMIAPKLINLVMLLLSIELFIISKIFDN